TKVYIMVPVQNMTRAIGFYRDAIGLPVEFESEFWTELRWRDATIALHGGASGDGREGWLGFHVADLDAALAPVGAGGRRRGREADGAARSDSKAASASSLSSTRRATASRSARVLPDTTDRSTTQASPKRRLAPTADALRTGVRGQSRRPTLALANVPKA